MKDSEKFIKEFYERDFKYHLSQKEVKALDFNSILKHPNISSNISIYKNILPKDKDDPILDLGFGDGWFVGICINLGYSNIHIADYDADKKISNIPNEFKQLITVHNIKESIPELLKEINSTFSFIHLSHVIEHIPRYSLFEFSDAIKESLKANSTFFLRTPNMLSPISQYLFYSTLGHEYGFAPLNIIDYLRSSGFDNIKFHKNRYRPKSTKQFFGSILKLAFITLRRLEFRILQGEYPLTLENELIVSCRKL